MIRKSGYRFSDKIMPATQSMIVLNDEASGSVRLWG
jgi:hypothetical protein